MALPTPKQMTDSDVTESQFKSGINSIIDFLEDMNNQSLVLDNEGQLEIFHPAIGKRAKTLDSGKVWYWNGSAWVDTGLSELDLAKVYVDALDSLKINSGKSYPFTPLSRNGVTSVANSDFNACILDVKVFNAEVGKYYKIAYFQNGATLTGTTGKYNWTLQSFDRATYGGTDSTTTLLNYTDVQPQIPADGKIQSV